jgi:hypothetical protein
MAEAQQPEPSIPQITTSNTKQEMLAAYKEVVKRLKEKREVELKPQARVEEKQKEEAIQVADALSTEGIAREVGNLRAEIGKVLVGLSDRMEEEIGRYLHAKRAVEAKEKELAEIFEIEKEALSLAALIEAQKERRERFEFDLSDKKQSLDTEIAETRDAWKAEQDAYKAEIQAREAAEKKKRERETEEYTYAFQRQKQLAQEQFEYDKARMERELRLRREELEIDLTTREQAVKEKEAELDQLRERMAAFPGELTAAVDKAVQGATERLTRESEAREALMEKESEGEQKVLQSRLESLQQTVNEQQQQIAILTAQIAKSYGQVQDIAVKAIEGAGNVRILSSVPPVPVEKRGSGQGES